MPDEAALWAWCCFVYSRYRGNRFIAALKATPRGREWICISKKHILCLDRPMFLRSKHIEL